MRFIVQTGIVEILIFVIFLQGLVQAEPLKLTVEKNGFAGTYYEASDHSKPVGLVVLGGSEGGEAQWLSELLSKANYSTLSIAYFKAPGTPDYLDEIDLEYFDKPMNWFAKRKGMQRKKIVVIGGSKGAELALLLASQNKNIQGVVAISPSSVVFQGIPKVFWPPRSSWKYKGKPYPFVPYDISRGINVANLRPMYELSLTHSQSVNQAIIPIEKINGPVLLLTGEDDTMWPACSMAESLVDRFRTKKFPHTFKHVNYNHAGHTLNEFFMLGGTKEGNKIARIESWKEIIKYLEKYNSIGKP